MYRNSLKHCYLNWTKYTLVEASTSFADALLITKSLGLERKKTKMEKKKEKREVEKVCNTSGAVVLHAVHETSKCPVRPSPIIIEFGGAKLAVQHT
ncbi:MAG: hypothetical protein A6F71_08585 [Cycloclasticus sp. symbiont of Poecilosclerida sp. M]|nr:MAG: hypothetical protein A6F71_08585 [Cycloclasticus sp. symbiont of Poecilosclerida sp. M]